MLLQVLGLFLLLAGTGTAQDFTVAIAVRASAGCGQVMAGPASEADLATQLREAGFRIAKAHSATLISEIDCIPAQGAARNAATAIHQCLALSEVVSTRSHSQGVALATTWRQCNQYNCKGAACEAAVRSNSRNLAAGFLSDFRDRSDAAARLAPPLPAKQEAPVDQLAQMVKTIFYLTYIAACIVLMFRLKWLRRVG